VDLAAPGVGIMSTVPGGSYGRYSGTSMATPHMAGVGVLIESQGAGLDDAQVRRSCCGTRISGPAFRAGWRRTAA
jgi:subtilisin family serine protease